MQHQANRLHVISESDAMKLESYSRVRVSVQKGVVLVEAMVAILLFSVGVLAVAGLQTTMLKNNSDAKYRAEANYKAQQMIGLMWSAPVSTYGGLFNTTTPVPELPNGDITVSQDKVNGPFQIVVTWTVPGQDKHQFVTFATITP
jgi:type IV pilus assembly protein PilV